MKTGDFVVWKDRLHYGVLTIVQSRTYRIFMFLDKVYKCSGPGLHYGYHWLDRCDLEPYALKLGDTVKVRQPNGPYDGYEGRVVGAPDADGFALHNGESTLICPQGKVLKEIQKRNRAHGIPNPKTTYFIV